MTESWPELPFKGDGSITTSIEQKSARFVALHQGSGVFIIPNPWDIGSARLLEALGFKALATTSSGFAQSLGRMDGCVTLEEKMNHCAELVAATTIPISADLENGFGDDPEAVANCIHRAAEAGVVGASIEDFTGDPLLPIYDSGLATERMAAAVEAARACPFPFTLTARAEQLLRSNYDLEKTIERLQAYEAAGADVLYAPGLKTLNDVRRVSNAVNKPLNVLGTMLPDCTVPEIGEAGAKRVSIGGSLAGLIATVVVNTASNLRDCGDLSWAKNEIAGSELKRLLN